jgi:UDP-N-acetylmuramoyl-tripeptide--D-alanyl-D-alanine ligase
MERAIEFCSSVAWKRNKIFVLGSMLELGAESETAHRSVCAKAAVSGVRSVLFFGSEIIEAARNTEWGAVKVYFLETIEEVIATLKEAVSEGDLVLVKGSRGMALERIMPALSERFQC